MQFYNNRGLIDASRTEDNHRVYNQECMEEFKVTKEPTCTEKGEQEGICTVCKATVKESVDMIPHVDDKNFVITKVATETEAGTKAT